MVPGGAQGVTEVAERGQKSTTAFVERRRQEAAGQLGVSTAQRQPVAASHEEHRRQVAVHSTQRLTVAYIRQQPNSSHSRPQQTHHHHH